jgi:hypothetical protein
VNPEFHKKPKVKISKPNDREPHVWSSDRETDGKTHFQRAFESATVILLATAGKGHPKRIK